ncbi:MAG TPA: CpaF family protein [Aliidongia sp.]|nr:CpaF family protein [Aliidongia sp.]
MFRRSAEVTPIGNRVADLTARRGRPLIPAASPTATDPAGKPAVVPATREQIDRALEELLPVLSMAIDIEQRAKLTRGEIAGIVGAAATAYFSKHRIEVAAIEHRDLVTALMRELLAGVPRPEAAPASPPVEPRRADADRGRVDSAKSKLQAAIVQRIDAAVAAEMPRDEFEKQLTSLVTELLAESKIQLNLAEQRELVQVLLADMMGLGPLEPLLRDETVTDIMVNGPYQTFVERRGKLELTDIKFRDNSHVLNIASRIVTRIGRRVDETSPLCDARLEDGSRVNIIIPPLAIDGPSISIRKFSKKGITLDLMAEQGNISPAMATLLKIAARCRLNILISGGTGSGKTTMLNALSRMIDSAERTVTIEDAAELQLQQPHVVRLETRPSNLEGNGEITMRDLLKNTLRMRPDRIILGEIRGAEALDVLQAMNTGHDGSMSTIHANRPREALTRLENMIGMAGTNLPSRAVRTQIAAAVHLIIQINRMRDGVRRVTHVMEIVGMEGDIITSQDLFTYQYQGEGPDGKLRGNFHSAGIRPHFLPRAEYFGLDRALLEAV